MYFLQFELAANMVTYYIGSVVGLSNTLLPLTKHQDSAPEIALEKQQKNADEMPVLSKI